MLTVALRSPQPDRRTKPPPVNWLAGNDFHGLVDSETAQLRGGGQKLCKTLCDLSLFDDGLSDRSGGSVGDVPELSRQAAEGAAVSGALGNGIRGTSGVPSWPASHGNAVAKTVPAVGQSCAPG
jgi:hypothetical protein